MSEEALGTRVPGLNRQKEVELRQAFNLYDRDGSGTVDRMELRHVLRAMDHFPTEEELKEMIDDVDVNADGVLQFEEFATMMIRKESDDDNTKMLLKKAFRILDCDDSGYLTPDELKDYMVTFGHEDFGGEDAWEMIQDADRNQDGKIDYEEFAEYLMTSGGV
jgi:Ca2+-binding EF-hand superfamily protein